MQYASVAQSQPEYASKVRKSPDLLYSILPIKEYIWTTTSQTC